jgi:WhiB family redox-sensing transcriptional regulator
MADGFRRTGVAGSWRASAECAKFDASWADRLWTFEDCTSEERPDPVYRTMARRVCGVCPVRVECLAEATVDSVQHGIFGGLRRNERRAVANRAERDGIRVYSRSGALRRVRFEAFCRWLRAHGEVFGDITVRERAMKELRRQSRRAARAQPNASPRAAGSCDPLF